MENGSIANINGQSVDANGRTNPAEMTDREIQIEMLQRLRAFSDAMEAISNNPMLKAMMPGI